MKNGDRVHHPDHGYGTVDEEGAVRVHVQWDDGEKGGYEVKQLRTDCHNLASITESGRLTDALVTFASLL